MSMGNNNGLVSSHNARKQVLVCAVNFNINSKIVHVGAQKREILGECRNTARSN